MDWVGRKKTLCHGLFLSGFVSWIGLSVMLLQDPNCSRLEMALCLLTGFLFMTYIGVHFYRLERSFLVTTHLRQKLSKKYNEISGLKDAPSKDRQWNFGERIDQQFLDWRLTVAEKEIGLLLLRGYSFKEIADLRGTAERTVRQQALEVYRKADTDGRAGFSAHFFEDFGPPL